jgi:hypothetical protein
MLQPPADVVLEDYVLMGEEYAKWMAQYSRASMKYYAENRPTMIADVQLQGISYGSASLMSTWPVHLRYCSSLRVSVC